MRAALAVFCTALVLALAPSASVALSGCRARVAESDGSVYLNARNVSGPLRWGVSEQRIDRELLHCQGTRVDPRRCLLGEPDTLAAKTPPASCSLHVSDDEGSCSAWVRGCTVGLRLVDESFARDDPRIAQAFSIEDAGSTLRFSSVNVQVVSGSGSTTGAVNGLGNLIVGYNEDLPHHHHPAEARSGSHNLVVGPDHEYTSYGGLIAGISNEVTGAHGSATGGRDNLVHGEAASVTGGIGNQAFGEAGAILGGRWGFADGEASTIGGGDWNRAAGLASYVAGGRDNMAAAWGATVVGGQLNYVFGVDGTASGGGGNQVLGWFGSTCGGNGNYAFGKWSTVTGGRGNRAEGDQSTVSGGRLRTASGEDDWVAGTLLEEE